MKAYRPHPAWVPLRRALRSWTGNDEETLNARVCAVMRELIDAGVVTGGEWVGDGTFYGIKVPDAVQG